DRHRDEHAICGAMKARDVLAQGEGNAAVGAQHLEDGVAVEEAAIVDAHLRVVGREERAVDRHHAAAHGAACAARTFARSIAASSRAIAPGSPGSIGSPSTTTTGENGQAI